MRSLEVLPEDESTTHHDALNSALRQCSELPLYLRLSHFPSDETPRNQRIRSFIHKGEIPLLTRPFKNLDS